MTASTWLVVVEFADPPRPCVSLFWACEACYSELT